MANGSVPLKKFKKNARYIHKRSEGLTHRNNAGTMYQGKKKLDAQCRICYTSAVVKSK